MRGGFGIAAPLFGVWLLTVGARQFSAAALSVVPGRLLRNVLAASLVLPWTIGLLTLQFDVETEARDRMEETTSSGRWGCG